MSYDAIRKSLLKKTNQTYIGLQSEIIKSPIYDNLVKLPPYIPYIGKDYFSFYPKILCYAINQNLSKHRNWTINWIDTWSENGLYAYDRLNHFYNIGLPLPIRPYAEGFIPLIALIMMNHIYPQKCESLSNYIDDVISVSNFVKFSTLNSASSSEISKNLWKICGEKFVLEEITALRPDYILAFGRSTYEETNKIIAHLSCNKPQVIYCRFPKRIPSLKRRPLTEIENETWRNEILPLLGKIRRYNDGNFHKFIARNYPFYFIDFLKILKLRKFD